MARLSLVLSLLAATLASAINPLFVGSSVQCQTCFDTAVATCPGDVSTRGFAECMCGGAGSELFVGTCIPTCTQTTGHTYDLYAIALYTYCINFFPELCGPARELGVTGELWEDSCGREALASKGAADDMNAGRDGSGGPTAGNDSPTQTGGGNGGDAAQTTPAPDGTSSPGANTAQGEAAATTTTRAGAPGMNGASVAAVMLGLGAVFVGIAL
ncbi:hypothetical protein QBC40DRAFT_318705 [Triangularia verruculosa]|uniref:Uncharacterized protein n=1 Tax=Triangularia verruculosa TaxID=2587418 RepID=A0AAN6XM81_9PEZI|nr:hypothetical protein QBC40DRAFT_318705 [Triangularia verruculosa]